MKCAEHPQNDSIGKCRYCGNEICMLCLGGSGSGSYFCHNCFDKEGEDIEARLAAAKLELGKESDLVQIGLGKETRGTIMRRICGLPWATDEETIRVVLEIVQRDRTMPVCAVCGLMCTEGIVALRAAGTELEPSFTVYHLCRICNTEEIEFLKKIWPDEAIKELIEFQKKLQEAIVRARYRHYEAREKKKKRFGFW